MAGKVIVVGGAGFIGTNVCLSALKRGLRVVVFDNLSRLGADLNLSILRKEGKERLEFYKGDIRSRSELENLFSSHRSALAIFHLAGQVAVTTSLKNPVEDFEINARGTLNVLEAVRKHCASVPLLYSSTNKVYGKLDMVGIKEGETRYEFRSLKSGVSESQNLEFYTPYGCSKGTADQYAMDYHRIYGLKTVVFRQSCIYGYNQFGVEDQGWVAWFTIAALFGKPITIYGNGKQLRDVLFIDDLVNAYWLAIENIRRTSGEIYNIGGSNHYSISLLELLDMLEGLVGKRLRVKYRQRRRGDQLVFVCDISKAWRDFGWKPGVDPEAGIGLLVRWAEMKKESFCKIGILK
jgi:CDP-paratose 2-epimerase